MRLLLIVAIVLALQPAKPKDAKGTTQSEATESAKQADATNNDGDNSRTPSVSVTVNSSLPAPNSDRGKQEADENMRVQRRLSFYTGLLVIAGFVTAALIWWQARETRRSVQAIRDSLPHQETTANAALLNAQALINAERPWVMIQVKEDEVTIGRDRDSVGLWGKRGVQFMMFNFGKTPAHILNCTEPKFEHPENPENELLIPPQYGPSDATKKFLAPRDSLPVSTWFNPSETAVHAIAERAVKGQGNRGSLVVYGLVEYSDGVAKTAYKTAFCYRWESSTISSGGGRFIPCGPKVYNEYT